MLPETAFPTYMVHNYIMLDDEKTEVLERGFFDRLWSTAECAGLFESYEDRISWLLSLGGSPIGYDPG